MEIKNVASVTFKYRVLVHKGSPENAGIEKEYQRYAKGELGVDVNHTVVVLLGMLMIAGL